MTDAFLQGVLDAINDEGEEIKACPGHVFTRWRDETGTVAMCEYCPKILVTQTVVDDNLGNAVEGGYDCRGETVEQIVLDLLAYSPDCDTATPDELRPFVEDWKKRNTQ